MCHPRFRYQPARFRHGNTTPRANHQNLVQADIFRHRRHLLTVYPTSKLTVGVDSLSHSRSEQRKRLNAMSRPAGSASARTVSLTNCSRIAHAGSRAGPDCLGRNRKQLDYFYPRLALLSDSEVRPGWTV
jgi:hypothetical protein